MRFTVVELMIAVAIVAVLAAVAIPAVHHYQLEAKRAELPMMVDGLTTALIDSHNRRGAWTDIYDTCGFIPGAALDRKALPWTNGCSTSIFGDIEFSPSSQVVYGRYTAFLDVDVGPSTDPDCPCDGEIYVAGLEQVDLSSPPNLWVACDTTPAPQRCTSTQWLTDAGIPLP